MDSATITNILTVAASLLGAMGVTWVSVGKFYSDRSKLLRDELRIDIMNLKGDVRALQDENYKCEEKVIKLTEEILALKIQNAEQEIKIKQLEVQNGQGKILSA